MCPEVNISKERRRDDQGARTRPLGGGAGVAQVTVRIPQRAMHTDEEALDIPVWHVEGARRMAQQQARFAVVPHFDVLVAERSRRLVPLVCSEWRRPGPARPRFRHTSTINGGRSGG